MSADKRIHPRFRFEHNVMLVAEGYAPIGCRMVNVCHGGLWLDRLESDVLQRHLSRELSRGKQPLVEVHLVGELQSQELVFHALARVLRTDSGGFGLRFLTEQAELVRLLQQRSRELGGAARLSVIPDSLREELLARSVRLMEKASAQFQHQFWQEDAAAGIDKVVIQFAFPVHRREWENSLQAFRKGSSSQSGGDLSLVDDQVFESWLKLQQISNRLARLCHDELFELNQYLSVAARRYITDQSNPVSPVSLVLQIHEAARREPSMPVAEPAFFRRLEETLNTLLPVLYGQLLGLFREAGVSVVQAGHMIDDWGRVLERQSGLTLAREERSARTEKQTGKTKPPAAAVADQAVLETSATPGLDRAPPAASAPKIEDAPEAPALPPEAQLQNTGPESGELAESAGLPGSGGDLLRFVNAINPILHGSQDEPGNTIQESHLLKLIQAQRQQLGERELTQGNNLGDYLASSLSDGAGLLNLSRLTRERLDVVDRILSLPAHADPVVARFLSDLRLPMAEVVLADETFLVQRDHPLRRCLNFIYRLAWQDSGSRHQRQLLEQAQDTFRELPWQTAAIQTLNQKLEEGLGRLQRQAEHQAERITRKYEGQEKLSKARFAVAQRLDALFFGRNVPAILGTLLDAGLEHKMVLEYLRSDSDPEALNKDLERLKSLIDFLTGKALDTLPEGLQAPELEQDVLARVESALEDAYQPVDARSALDELQAQLDDPVLIEFIAYETRATGLLPDAPESALEDEADVDSRWTRRAAELKVGDWLDRQAGDDPSRRLRLVWIDRSTDEFVFLPEGDVHEHRMQFSELVSALQAGELIFRPESQAEWVDQCLFQLVDELYTKMAFQSSHDPLTGCLYRHELEKHLEATLMSRLRMRDQERALIWLDVDQFAVLNSSHGTGAGDHVLKAMVGLLQSQLTLELRGTATAIGRMGSNEFALYLPNATVQQALNQAENFQKYIASNPFRVEDESIYVTVSVGVLSFDGRADCAADLINLASQACETAKRQGGNRVQVFRPSEQEGGATASRELVRQIDKTLSEGLLGLRVQRIVSLDDEGALPKYEMLIRMPESQQGILNAQEFINAIERFRRSVQFDSWVVKQTLDWARSNPEKMMDIAQLNINISGHSVGDDRFLHFLDTEMQKGGFDTSRICFELTETAAVASLHYAADFMNSLKRYGCRFALDDFGTGFSSYAYLQQLPVDYLKIDGVFIQDIENSEKNYAMVKSITELGHYLGMEVVAECVETAEAEEALAEIGVQWLQGWHIERPKPLSEL